MMSSGNKKMEQPSFRATLIMYVAFNFFSSSIISRRKTVSWFLRLFCQIPFLGQPKTITVVNNHTTFTLGNKVPVDNPRLHSTKKLEKEYPSWQTLVLKTTPIYTMLPIYHHLKNYDRWNIKWKKLVFLNLKTLYAGSSACAFYFLVSPI